MVGRQDERQRRKLEREAGGEMSGSVSAGDASVSASTPERAAGALLIAPAALPARWSAACRPAGVGVQHAVGSDAWWGLAQVNAIAIVSR
jgi:hypothetical protein